MILLVNTAKEALHINEFVKPVEKLMKESFQDYFVKKYTDVTKEDLEKSDKVIICGTSLFDNDYLEHLEKFFWVEEFDKPVLGICAGAQIVQLVLGGKTIKDESIKEIGQVEVIFDKLFLGEIKKRKVYSLHRNLVLSDEFLVYGKSAKCPHATKHKKKEIYCCLFHPEVYNKGIIFEFLKL